jgi:hypothetical protein
MFACASVGKGGAGPPAADGCGRLAGVVITEYDTSLSDGSRVPSATGTAAGGGATSGSASTCSAGAHSAKAPNIHTIELEHRKRLLAWTTAGQFARDRR